MPTLVNFLSFPTTFCQLLLANYHSSLNWSNVKSFLYATKKKIFLWSLKIIIWSSLLYFRLCLCVRTFYCIMEKVFFFFFFFYQGFLSRRLTTHRTVGEGRGPSYSTLQLPPAHEHSDIYLQLCT